MQAAGASSEAGGDAIVAPWCHNAHNSTKVESEKYIFRFFKIIT